MSSTIRDVFVLLWNSGDILLFRYSRGAAFLIFLILVGSWLPALVFPFRDRSVSPAVTFLALATGGGVMACICCWTASLYLSDGVFAGTLALFVLAGLGGLRLPKILRELRRSQWTSAFLAATCFAVMLAIWHWGCTELPYRNSLVFCDRRGRL